MAPDPENINQVWLIGEIFINAMEFPLNIDNFSVFRYNYIYKRKVFVN